MNRVQPDMNTEPKFWGEFIRDIPCVSAVVENWQAIYSEFNSAISDTSGKWLWDVPRAKIGEEFKTPSTPADTKLYTGTSWKLMGTGVELNADGLADAGKNVSRRIVEMKSRMPYEDALQTLRNCLPETVGIIEQYAERKEMMNAAISVISPGTIINPHRGDPSFMRVHVGLQCDPECQITVGNDESGYESMTWEPGGVIAFKDGGQFFHSVIHNGTVDRWIFIFDIPLNYLRTLVGHEFI